jgi:hypothetical protein
MGRPVAVSGFDGDDEKHILVVTCLEPSEAYASKDQKHLGFIVGGKLVPTKDAQPISEREHALIMRHFFGLRAFLTNVFETDPTKGPVKFHEEARQEAQEGTRA